MSAPCVETGAARHGSSSPPTRDTNTRTLSGDTKFSKLLPTKTLQADGREFTLETFSLEPWHSTPRAESPCTADLKLTATRSPRLFFFLFAPLTARRERKLLVRRRRRVVCATYLPWLGGAVRCGAVRGGRAVSRRRADSLVQLCAEKEGQTKHTEVDLYQSDSSQTARHVSRSVTERARSHARPRTHLLPKTWASTYPTQQVKGFNLH